MAYIDQMLYAHSSYPSRGNRVSDFKTMGYTDFKCCMLILHTHPEGTVSQFFFNLGLGFYFMTKNGKHFTKFVNIIF